jgi:hypothetical protein
MRKLKIMAEQNNGNEVLYNSRKDRWSRKAKHNLPRSERPEINETFTKGEFAMYEDKAVEIVVATNKDFKTGIDLGGKVTMVNTYKLSRLDEAVIGGLTNLTPLNRIMQLAGLPENASDENLPQVLDEATDSTNMFNALYKANLAGEFKNNPDAARIATVGQVLTGLNTVIDPVRKSIDAGLVSKIDAAIGLGAFLIKTAQEKTRG